MIQSSITKEKRGKKQKVPAASSSNLHPGTSTPVSDWQMLSRERLFSRFLVFPLRTVMFCCLKSSSLEEFVADNHFLTRKHSNQSILAILDRSCPKISAMFWRLHQSSYSAPGCRSNTVDHLKGRLFIQLPSGITHLTLTHTDTYTNTRPTDPWPSYNTG